MFFENWVLQITGKNYKFLLTGKIMPGSKKNQSGTGFLKAPG